MNIRQTVAAALSLVTIAAYAEKRPYSRYEPIVERQMFGPLPVTTITFPPRFFISVILSMAEATAAWDHYLKVGESRDGWKVEAADAKAATMTIVKDDIEVSLTLGGNSGKGGGTVAKRAQDAATVIGAGASLGGLRHMRRRRDAAEYAKIREEQAAERAEREAKAAEEKAQRDAEREEQRQQLMAIQEELRKAREAKEAARNGADNENDNAE